MTALPPPSQLMSPLAAMIHGGSGLPPAPIYSHGCLTGQAFGDGTCHELLRPSDWMRQRDGRLTVGALAVLADSATGFSVSTRLPAETSMVTAQLRLELFDGVPPDVGVFEARAMAVHVDAEVGFARADLTTGDGRPVGMATMRSAQVPHPLAGDSVAVHDAVESSPLPAGWVDDVLATEIKAASAEHAEVAVRARPQLSNLARNIHGGVVVMMVERAFGSLLACIDEDQAAFRPLDVDVVFARPIEADDSTVTASVTMVAATRRFVQLSGAVTRADGRVAATVRAFYARPA